MFNQIKVIIDLLAEIVSILRILRSMDLQQRSVRFPSSTEQITALLQEIAANTRPLAATPLLDKRKIYKTEAIEVLGVSDRTYARYKAKGLLKPRGIGHDFYYQEDLEAAMAESIRKGRV